MMVDVLVMLVWLGWMFLYLMLLLFEFYMFVEEEGFFFELIDEFFDYVVMLCVEYWVVEVVFGEVGCFFCVMFMCVRLFL